MQQQRYLILWCCVAGFALLHSFGWTPMSSNLKKAEFDHALQRVDLLEGRGNELVRGLAGVRGALKETQTRLQVVEEQQQGIVASRAEAADTIKFSTAPKIPQNPPNALRTRPAPAWEETSRKTLWSSWCGGMSASARDPRCETNAVPSSEVMKASKAEASKAAQQCRDSDFEPCTFYSQQHEDAAVFNMYFSGLRDGTYVELGALDGTQYSNTRFLEDTMGWGGVLIEASPPSYKSLVANRGSSGKNALFHRAVCPTKGFIDFFGTNAEAGIIDSLSEQLKGRGGAMGAQTQKVECEPLRDILPRAGVESIDFWSLDVEGAELGVLQSMDWSIPVHVLLIERNSNDLAIESLLLGEGFEYVREQRGNRLWVNPKYDEAKVRGRGAK